MPPKLEHVLICEDIRKEEGNKITLVGVLGANIVIGEPVEFPVRLQQLCVFLRWKQVSGGEEVYLSIAYEGDEFFKTSKPAVLVKPAILQDYSQLSFHFPGFPVKGFGEYRVRVYLGDPDTLQDEWSFWISPARAEPKAV